MNKNNINFLIERWDKYLKKQFKENSQSIYKK